MKRVLSIAVVVLMIFSAMNMFAGGQKESAKDGTIVIGANIYSFADNFMNGVMKPELERYAKEKGAKIEIVDSEGQQAKLNDQVDVFITKKVSVLAINLVDPAAAGTIIAKAKLQNPLILLTKKQQKQVLWPLTIRFGMLEQFS